MAEPFDPNRLDGILQKYKGEEGGLIPILQEVQELDGYLSEEVLNCLGKRLHIPTSRIFGVVSFYAQFYTTPRGRHTVLYL
jgi:NADH-quinone oxidoreductase subunit E